MKRTILAVLAGVLLASGTASAQYQHGYNPAGNNWQAAGANGLRSAGGQPCPPGGQNQSMGRPGVLGPWYLYFPYEAHFAVPAHPQYPYWPSPQTLGGGRTDFVPPVYAVPSYWK